MWLLALTSAVATFAPHFGVTESSDSVEITVDLHKSDDDTTVQNGLRDCCEKYALESKDIHLKFYGRAKSMIKTSYLGVDTSMVAEMGEENQTAFLDNLKTVEYSRMNLDASGLQFITGSPTTITVMKSRVNGLKIKQGSIVATSTFFTQAGYLELGYFDEETTTTTVGGTTGAGTTTTPEPTTSVGETTVVGSTTTTTTTVAPTANVDSHFTLCDFDTSIIVTGGKVSFTMSRFGGSKSAVRLEGGAVATMKDCQIKGIVVGIRSQESRATIVDCLCNTEELVEFSGVTLESKMVTFENIHFDGLIVDSTTDCNSTTKPIFFAPPASKYVKRNTTLDTSCIAGEELIETEEKVVVMPSKDRTPTKIVRGVVFNISTYGKLSIFHETDIMDKVKHILENYGYIVQQAWINHKDFVTTTTTTETTISTTTATTTATVTVAPTPPPALSEQNVLSDKLTEFHFSTGSQTQPSENVHESITKMLQAELQTDTDGKDLAYESNHYVSDDGPDIESKYMLMTLVSVAVIVIALTAILLS